MVVIDIIYTCMEISKEVINLATLTSFVYCISAERATSPDGKEQSINANGIVSALGLDYIPGGFSFAIVFSVLGVDVTVPSNTMRIVLRKQNEPKPLVDTGNFVLPPITEPYNDSLPVDYKGYNMTMDFRNVIFTEEGLYTTEVYFADSKIGESPVYVFRKKH